MATLFKEVSYNLAILLQQIDMGIIGTPYPTTGNKWIIQTSWLKEESVWHKW
jgi:hypothetical protein